MASMNVMARPESDFPTIRDLRDRLSELVESGLGDHPVQIVVVPDSTIQAIALTAEGAGYDGKRPVLMIELPNGPARMPVSFISTAHLSGGGGGMQTREKQ
jgi:hypothetical protein